MSATTKHSAFIQPKSDITLWKYYDLPFFISLIKDSSIYFSRLDKVDDPCEGKIGPFTVSRKNKEVYARMWYEDGLIDEPTIDKAMVLFKKLDVFIKNVPKESFVSCWHANENESIAMWKIYSKSEHSIAIKTKYSKLVNSLSEDFYIGCIEYKDYKSEYIHFGNMFSLAMTKKKEYEYENEIRIIKRINGENSESNIGFKKKVSLENIIDEVIISPGSPKWFDEIILDICTKYGYAFQIKKSNIYDGNYSLIEYQ